MGPDFFTTDISRHVWDVKYRFRNAETIYDRNIEDTWRRVARALAAVEAAPAHWEDRFYSALQGFRFLPGGRILAGAGTARRVTLFNCFVMGQLDDSMDGIFDGLKEGEFPMQQGGGVGYDFSTLRPQGARAKGVGSVASGPVSFMRIWDAMCATLLSTGARRGAMMATLRCDHPDIETFITAKQAPGELRRFNLSVLVSDEFMDAVRTGTDWALVFPLEKGEASNEDVLMRRWSGGDGPVACRVYRRVPARELWRELMRSTYEYAEPGVLFIDRINRLNNLWYREHISATNPCVTTSTWVHTADGPRQVRDLCGHPFTAIVDGKLYPSTAHGFFETGTKPVVCIRTREGYSVRLTADHPVLRVTRLAQFARHTAWVPAKTLVPGDRVALHDHRGLTRWDGPYREKEGYLLGLLIGDGTFSEGQPKLRAWPMTARADPRIGVESVMEKVGVIASLVPQPADFSGWRAGGAGCCHLLRIAHLTRLANSLDVRPGNKTITPAIERCSSDFYRGLLRGLFDTNGCIQGSQPRAVRVRLAQNDERLLEAAQRMLHRLGIRSTLYRKRRPAGMSPLPDGRGARPAYERRAHPGLVISGDDLLSFAREISFADTDKQRRLQSALNGYARALGRERFVATVDEIVADGIEKVFDVQVPGVNAFDANGFYVHNCGEIPLPAFGACDLGSVNLVPLVRDPFTDRATLNIESVAATVKVAVRMMDDVIDASQFPLAQQAAMARGTRRIGLGLTGLADALIMLGLHYAEPRARAFAARVMQAICHSAYRTSIEIAQEKGPFPFFDRDKYVQGQFTHTLPTDIQEDIARHGIRNSHLTAIAPTGTISLLANNVSSGLEPVYDFAYTRRVVELDGSYSEHSLTDYAFAAYRRGDPTGPLPRAFVDTHALPPQAHLDMQAALQPFVDNSISKTINVPRECSFAAFQNIYELAYARGLKGCTTFRPNPVTGSVLAADERPAATVADSQCCNIEREAD